MCICLKKVQILCSVVSALISLLTILQYIVFVLPDNHEEWNVFESFLYCIISSRYWIFVLVILILLLISLTISNIILSTSKHYHFKVQSNSFKKFFIKWYNQPGKLIVICDDIDWTYDNDDFSIFNALEKKCTEGLTLYLGTGFKSNLSDQLRKKGAIVMQAKPSLIRDYSFSCIAPMDHYSNIIIRNKKKDIGQEVEFSELSDDRVITLLTALLEDN